MYMWLPLSITSKLHWLNLGPDESDYINITMYLYDSIEILARSTKLS